MKRLETDRLILREWNINDVADVYEYAKSKKVGPMAGWKPHENIEETEKIINMLMEENETWVMWSKEGKKVIGSIGLHATDDDKELMLGFVLSEDFWGNGLVVEGSKSILNYVFNSLGIERVSTYHYSFNNQSKRVIEKLGFKYIETKEKADVMWDGTAHDSVCYMLSKEGFFNGNL